MPNTVELDLPITPLDPDLLAVPFGVQTNWHVITGAPCCGKTTVIDLLTDLGFKTVAETARQYMECEIAKGRTFEELFESLEVEYAILDLQLRTEQALDPAQLIFMDRALPDSLAFSRMKNIDPNEMLPDCLRYQYVSVFILDCLPYQQDGLRSDEVRLADYLDKWHDRDYAALGYRVTRVPVIPPRERVDFILGTVNVQTTELLSY